MPRFVFNHLIGLSLAAVFCAWTGPHVHAQGAFDPVSFEASVAAAASADERLDILNQTLAELEAENDGEPDIRTLFDLAELRLETWLELGDTESAAGQAAVLAFLASEYRDLIDREPAYYHGLSGDLFEQADGLEYALEQYLAEVQLRLDAGQTGAPVAQVYEDLERVAMALDEPDLAQQYAEARAAILDPSSSGTKSAGDEGFTEVEVFYATDRAQTGEADPNDFYGHGRGELEYGIVTVSIPDLHQAGAIERPSIWRLEFGSKPAKHVMVREIEPMESGAYFEKMRARVAENDRKEAFVFIHGFNVRFDAAARRAAQLAYDMNYSGVPVLYSWPSAGKSINYVADTAVVRLSGRRLSQFLEELQAESGAETIHIIAHSMGNRALTDALELLALRTNAADAEEPLFGQVFFAAPDVDAGLFREMLTTIEPLAKRMTLYTSENDWALVASRKLHGGAPRAGQAGDTLLAEPNFDTVDMSSLGEDMLAHSYFANDSSALVDIVSLLWLDPEPGQRCGLDPVETGDGGSAWKYEKGACLDNKLVSLISHLWNSGATTSDEIREVVQSLVDDPAEADRLQQALIALASAE